MSMANINAHGLPFYSFYVFVAFYFSSMDLRRKIMIRSHAIVLPFMIFVWYSLYLDAIVMHYCCGIIVVSYSLVMHALTTRKKIKLSLTLLTRRIHIKLLSR
ncbi:hypothetical protein ABFS82_09G034700 [Erythranthe guttata]